MINTALHIKIADNADDINICYKLRETIFVREQNYSFEVEFDNLDAISKHFLLFENDFPIGNARISTDNTKAFISRVCVLKNYRKNGAGRFLMEEVINYCKKQNFEKIILVSQEHDIGFYSKLGFETFGEMYMDANIPHFKMQLML